jgi:hypothetical protein
LLNHGEVAATKKQPPQTVPEECITATSWKVHSFPTIFWTTEMLQNVDGTYNWIQAMIERYSKMSNW